MNTTDFFGIDLNSARDISKQEALDILVIGLFRRGWGDKLVIKGGWAMTKLFPNLARATVDVDACMLNTEDWYKLKSDLCDICDTELSRYGYSMSKTKDPDPGFSSGRMKFITDRKTPYGESRIIGMDVSIDPQSPRRAQIEFEGFLLNVPLFETMLSDKTTAMFSDKRYRRAKDLYDIYEIAISTQLLSTVYVSQLDANEFWGNYSNSPFSQDALLRLSDAWDKLELTSADRSHALKKPSFSVVINTFAEVILPIADDYFSGKTDLRVWDHNKLQWRAEK